MIYKTDNIKKYILLNFLVILVLMLLFQSFNPYKGILVYLFSFIATLSTVILFLLLVNIITAPLRISNKFFFWSSVVLISLVQIFIIVDFFIFRIYKFHINGMVLDIFLSPAAWQNVKPGFSLYFGLLLSIGILITIHFFISKLVKKFEMKKNFSKNLIFIMVFIVILDKMIFGFSNLFPRFEITSSVEVIPYYLPVTFKRVAEKYFGIDPYENSIKLKQKTEGRLDYPKNKIELNKLENYPDIFIFVLDAVRGDDVVTPEVMPNIFSISKNNLIFKNHFSGSNCTRFGIFSLINSVHPSYWFSFVNEKKGAVIFDVLKELNYDINIISSSNLNWPEFKHSTFPNVLDFIKDDFKGSSWEKDLLCNQYLIEKIKINSEKPMFSLIYFDAPHGPYSYPEEFAYFKPDDGGNINYLTLNEDKREILFNQYRNAIKFNDKLVGDFLEVYKKSERYKNSIIILTSDHGEEFFEYGNFGHNGTFSRAQTNSFLVMKWSDNKKGVYTNLTSHVDVVPAIMEELGVINPSIDYSNGENIFNVKRHSVFFFEHGKGGIMTKDYTLEFPTGSRALVRGNRVYDNKTYQEVKISDINKQFDFIILEKMKEGSWFYK